MMTSFSWFTSFMGYPDFFEGDGRGRELADVFLTFAKASDEGLSYSQTKDLFTGIAAHQVETKKAAFQEFGLLYVLPRSDRVSLSPLGRAVYDICSSSDLAPARRRDVLLMLCRGLARYQFNNPLPVGGNQYRNRAASSDVLPYLATYYIMEQLDGRIASSELLGMVFGMQEMGKLSQVVKAIGARRGTHKSFAPLSALPARKGTRNNLRIYFMSHLSLNNQILTRVSEPLYDDDQEPVYNFTVLGRDIVRNVLDEQWPHWRRGDLSGMPLARAAKSIEDYFCNYVGQECPTSVVAAARRQSKKQVERIAGNLLGPADVEELLNLPDMEFEEGRKRKVHARIERVRNNALVAEAKRLFKGKHGRLFCEACDFDFEKKYGSRGEGYIEAHHKTPISELQGAVKLRVRDLDMVCSNCHRMLHRRPWITVKDLRTLCARKRNIPDAQA